MESDPAASHPAARQALAAAERATASLWTDYPPTPWWFFPAIGVWAGALVVALAELWDRPVLSVPAVVLLLGLEVAFLQWTQRARGTWPRLRSAPVEFAPVIRAYAVGVTLVLAATLGMALAIGTVAAAAVAAVTVTVGLVLHERAYAAAAQATRRRLG